MDIIGTPTEASTIASVDHPVFSKMESAIHSIYPETLVTPGLVMAGTDAFHFSSLVDDCFYFRPMIIHPRNVNTIHGIDERLSVAEYENAVRFYINLISQL